MKIIRCPINGPRPLQEFHFGGEVRETTLNARWILHDDGQWYRELKPETLSQSMKKRMGNWPPAFAQDAPVEQTTPELEQSETE